METDVTVVLVDIGRRTLVDFKELFSAVSLHSLKIILNDNVPYTLKV